MRLCLQIPAVLLEEQNKVTEIKVGVVGIGNIGFVHATSIFTGKVPGMRLAAVCDCDLKRQEVADKEFPGVAVYGSIDSMLQQADLDAVIIAVPHPSHSDLAMAAFAAGKHVLVEKPVDITVSKARQLNEAAAKSGKQFAIMFNQRTGGLFQKAKEIMQSGQLGQLKRSVWIITNWYRTQHYYDSGSWRATWAGEGGGVLMNQAPHQLDLWQWICGMPETVTAFYSEGKYHDIEVEDDATLHVRFPGGAEGVFITSTGEYPGTNRLEISGTKGKLVLEDGVLKHWILEQDERQVCGESTENFCRIPFTYQEYTQEKEVSGHMMILQNFANAILKGESLVAPGYEGIRELTLQNAAYLSAWKGSVPVQLPLDEQEYDAMLAKKQSHSAVGSQISEQNMNTQYSQRWQINW